MKIAEAGVIITNQYGFVSLSGKNEARYMSVNLVESLSGNSVFSVASVYNAVGANFIWIVGQSDFEIAAIDKVIMASIGGNNIIQTSISSGDIKSDAIVETPNIISTVAKRLANNTVYLSVNDELFNTGLDNEETPLSLGGLFVIGGVYSIERLSEIVLFTEDLSELNRVASHQNQINYYNI